jgi:hypothetical protein
MAGHTFRTHLPHLSYVTPSGTFVSIPGSLMLDDSEHPELVKELTAIAADPGSPIYKDKATEDGVKSDLAETQQAVVAEMRAKALAATIADKAGK